MAAKRKASSKAKAPAKKRSSTATGIRKREAENYRAQKEQKSQELKAIILSAVSILVLCLVLIKGENVWLWLHNGMFGLFGVFTFLVPVFMIAVAVMKAFDKFKSDIGEKLIETGLTLYDRLNDYYLLLSDANEERMQARLDEICELFVDCFIKRCRVEYDAVDNENYLFDYLLLF